MIGRGENRKSMAYVGNISRYLAVSTAPRPGVTILNYADKPDLNTAELINIVSSQLGKKPSRFRLPIWVGLLIGYVFDGMSQLVRKELPVSSVRVRNLCGYVCFRG